MLPEPSSVIGNTKLVLHLRPGRVGGTGETQEGQPATGDSSDPLLFSSKTALPNALINHALSEASIAIEMGCTCPPKKYPDGARKHCTAVTQLRNGEVAYIGDPRIACAIDGNAAGTRRSSSREARGSGKNSAAAAQFDHALAVAIGDPRVPRAINRDTARRAQSPSRKSIRARKNRAAAAQLDHIAVAISRHPRIPRRINRNTESEAHPAAAYSP